MILEAFIKVDDPKLKQIRWAKECLFIRFNDEKSKTYYGVPAATFIGMTVATSVYEFYDLYIRGNFETKC